MEAQRGGWGLSAGSWSLVLRMKEGTERREEILSEKRKGGQGDREVDPPPVGRDGAHLCVCSVVSTPPPPPSVPQEGLRKSDSYLMTLSPASSSEQPVVTGELKGTEVKVQVIDL